MRIENPNVVPRPVNGLDGRAQVPLVSSPRKDAWNNIGGSIAAALRMSCLALASEHQQTKGKSQVVARQPPSVVATRAA
jgi:hypothetical protein